MKNRMLFWVALFWVICVWGQVKTPDVSPKSVVNQTIGLTEVEVVYSRPSIKGRMIFGDLVPFDKIWRTGANAATTIEFSTDVTFEGIPVKEGKYALYSVPGKKLWKVLLYADHQIWGDPGNNYDPKKVVAEVTVTPQTISPKVETFRIGFDELKPNEGFLSIAWEQTLVQVLVGVNSHQVVLESIKKTMAGPTASDYHRAAAYYFEQNMDLDKAIEWVNKAAELNPKAYWVLKLKSEIQAAKNNFTDALKTANQALEAAQKAGNQGYVKMIEQNIALWKKKQ
ncbi:DUF2911 domain-containing protein [Capnocytophaga canimorsus]|uniref:Uncharacterized protein n=1 Tax=Capnocytophaga canimorsus (strain 5) TaxID=860228 RepID=F9YQ88_CAPCC|nr:DUF2911 domain-containing protein [Capnocytophaga canimorsus]AEK22256.1 Conserved hypothetical protein [Capnocytophaga canimorsus Cc5]CEN44220.1 conserved exported hypothetical protein [Capnocytophaga canimorsus]VEJ19659.1 Protein of uncharacterised function (DUF2911) [Capnocytophaga canimorsus]